MSSSNPSFSTNLILRYKTRMSAFGCGLLPDRGWKDSQPDEYVNVMRIDMDDRTGLGHFVPAELSRFLKIVVMYQQ